METENKPSHPHLVQYLIDAKGYQLESAQQVVDDVIQAQKTTRLLELEQYRNKRVLVEVGGLHVETFVHDVKVTAEGIMYQVRPVAGDKNIWVRNFIKVL